jgi:DNA-binding protein HU-beta
MHKGDLIKHLSKKYRRSQKHYQEALNEILEGITDQLKQGKPVHLLGFGSFYTRIRKPSKSRNFKTQELITTPELRLADFRPGKLLKQAVRKKEQAGGKKSKKGLLSRFLQ